MPKNSDTTDADLLKDLSALLEQTQASGASVSGNIEIAAMKMAAVKSLMRRVEALSAKRIELLQKAEPQIRVLRAGLRSNEESIDLMQNWLTKLPSRLDPDAVAAGWTVENLLARRASCQHIISERSREIERFKLEIGECERSPAILAIEAEMVDCKRQLERLLSSCKS